MTNHFYNAFPILTVVVGLVVVACGGSPSGEEAQSVATDVQQNITTTLEASTAPTSEPSTTSSPNLTIGQTEVLPEPPPVADFNDLDPSVAQATSRWSTDWSKGNINLGELQLGIWSSDPRDAIPPIDDPIFQSVAEASQWLEAQQPGALVVVGEQARFYPLGILHRHEIVNDWFGEIPVAVTYCPLCNTALAFDRRVAGGEIRLGVSGLLRNSDLVMWDDRTVSLWQQATGEGIVGELTGVKLERVQSAIVGFGEFARAYPEGMTLSPEAGRTGEQMLNPYEGYTSLNRPFLFDGEIDPRYPALERVVGVAEGEVNKAYPFSVLTAEGAVNDVVGGVPVAVFWGGETADALDRSRISDSRVVGTGVAYRSQVGDQVLYFSKNGDTFSDAETGSTWNLLGQAVGGPLMGERLEIAVHANEFWFAWAAFFPQGEVYGGRAA